MCAVMYEILRFRLRGCANFGKFLVLPFFFSLKMCFLLWIAASCMYLEIRATFGQSYDAMLKSCYLLLHCVGGVMLQVWRLWSNLWIPSSSHSDFWMHHLQTLNHHKHLMLPNVCMWYIVLVLGQLTIWLPVEWIWSCG